MLYCFFSIYSHFLKIDITGIPTGVFPEVSILFITCNVSVFLHFLSMTDKIGGRNSNNNSFKIEEFRGMSFCQQIDVFISYQLLSWVIRGLKCIYPSQ